MSKKGENIYHRKDGRWEGLYKAQSGRFHSVYGHSYAEVKSKISEFKLTPVKSAPTSMTTIKECADEWISNIKFRVKPSTLANYMMKLQKHILPVFGNLRYDSLTVQMLNSFIEQKLSSGLSAKYVADIIIVFKSISKYISRVHGFSDILANVSTPKVQKQDMKLLSPDQQKKLCSYILAHTDLTTICILLSLYTGLRVGEVCALMWSDIDFQKSVLTVRRTVQRIGSESGTRLNIGKPKSLSSCRSIPVPEFLITLLREFRSNEDFYVLSGSLTIIEPRTLQRRFKSILKKADLPEVNYHGLRHMFATNCIALGFDVKTLSEILGHSSVETTLNRYVHSSMERKAECMKSIQLIA